MQPSLWIDRVETFFGRAASRINAISTAKLILCLIGIFLVWRFATLDFVEKSGDAVWKWSFLRYYAITGEWFPPLPDHHQGRWAINLPVLFFMKIFGPDMWVYYLYPLLTGLAAGLLLFALTFELSGSKAAGTVAFLLLLLFPPAVRESSQFLPMLSAACWMLAAGLLLVRRIGRGGGEFVFFAAGVLVAVSYGCKFTSLYWGAAFMLGLALLPFEEKTLFRVGKLRFGPGIFLFGFGILAVLTAETLLLNHFFHVRGGRVEIILGSHLGQAWEGRDYLSLPRYLLAFLRPLDLSGKYFDSLPLVIVLAGGFLPAILWLRRNEKSTARKFVALSFLTVYFLHCYVVYKVFPFLQPERPHGRYFIILGLFSLAMLTTAWPEIRALATRLLRNRHTALLTLWSVTGMLLVLMFIRVGNQWSHGDSPAHVIRNCANFDTARTENLPVMMRMLEPEEAFRKGRLSTDDLKYGNTWTALQAPAPVIVARRNGQKIVRDANGGHWEMLWNGDAVTPGKPVRALLLKENDSRIGVVTVTVEPPVCFARETSSAAAPAADKNDAE